MSTRRSDGEDSTRKVETDAMIRQRVQMMQDAEIVDFLRDTVVKLDALADRLEIIASTREEGRDA